MLWDQRVFWSTPIEQVPMTSFLLFTKYSMSHMFLKQSYEMDVIFPFTSEESKIPSGKRFGCSRVAELVAGRAT